MKVNKKWADTPTKHHFEHTEPLLTSPHSSSTPGLSFLLKAPGGSAPGNSASSLRLGFPSSALGSVLRLSAVLLHADAQPYNVLILPDRANSPLLCQALRAHTSSEWSRSALSPTVRLCGVSVAARVSVCHSCRQLGLGALFPCWENTGPAPLEELTMPFLFQASLSVKTRTVTEAEPSRSQWCEAGVTTPSSRWRGRCGAGRVPFPRPWWQLRARWAGPCVGSRRALARPAPWHDWGIVCG